MIKKILFVIINILSVLIIVAAVFVLCTVIFTRSGDVPSVFGYTALRVTTGSMAPTYDIDTLILVKKLSVGILIILQKFLVSKTMMQS